MRTLRAAPSDPGEVLVALRSALEGGDALLASESPEAVDETVPQHTALVIQTSGSTGTPKRVALSADALLASAAASDAALGGPGQWLLALPTSYIAGINVLVRSIAADTQPVLLAPGHFEPSEFAAAALLLDQPLRYTSLVPAQLAVLVDAAGDDIDLLEVYRRFDRILVGGQATPPDLLERCLELGLNVTRTYGSSETSGGCVYDGVPIGTAQAQIVDGQIELTGPMLAEGYLGDEERTAAIFVMRDGLRWYRTGDGGEIVDGVLRVTGRLDNVIISGGVKVSLDAVERFVRSTGLTDAVAVRAPSVRWGEVPVIVSTQAADLAALRREVAARLGKAAAPAAVITVENLPVLSSGKPDRVALTRLVALTDR